MLAFVGTAVSMHCFINYYAHYCILQVHALLLEWSTGQHKAADFKAASYADAYTQHITLLTAIKTRNLRGYHAMMRDLYQEVACVNNSFNIVMFALLSADISNSATNLVVAQGSAVPSALALIDFDMMPSD